MSEPDFDKFLTDLTTEEAKQHNAELQGLDVEYRAEKALGEYHLDRIFSFDPDIQEALQSDLLEDITRNLLETEPDDEEDVRELKAQHITHELIHSERTLVYIAMMTAAVNEERLKQHPSPATLINETKKKFIAELLVVHGLESDDTFLTFVDHFIPGEQLRLDADDDAHFITDAIEAYTHKQEEEQTAQQFVTEAIKLVGDDEATAEPHPVIMELFTARIVHSLNNVDRSRLDAAFDEILRNHAIPHAAAQQLIALLLTYYPL
jgi:hypothetical protein